MALNTYTYNTENNASINTVYSGASPYRNTLTGSNKSKGDNQRTVTQLFANTHDFKDVSKYNLMRGVPDFGSLVQFNPYETGYAAFVICEMPKFMQALAEQDAGYQKLVNNFAHILEYEFKSFDGLQDINADTITLGDDLNSINVINKVNMQSASEFSLTYDEKSGSPITKFCKLYLTGIKDPRTQVKTYHGLIHNGLMEPGFENEVFTFLYINTDNTMREIEAAYLLIGCQINSADTDMYNYTKGSIDKREVTVKFSGYPISSPMVDRAAQDILTYLISAEAGARQIIFNSNDFNYTGIESITDTLESYGNADPNKYQSLKGTGTAKYTTDSYYNTNQ